MAGVRMVRFLIILGSLAETLRGETREPVTPLEVVVLIVSDDRAVVEADLAAGRLLCSNTKIARSLPVRRPGRRECFFALRGGIYLSQVEVRQGRSMAGTGGDRIGSVGRGRPGRGLTIRLR